MSFIAKLEKGELFKKIIDGIKDIVKSANFDITQAGIKMQAMDVAQVSLVSFCMKSECFSEYECDESLTVGINIESLAKILKCVKKDYSLTIKTGGDSDHITFLIESREKESEFNLNIISIDCDDLVIEESEPDSVIEMNSSKFKEICTELNELGDAVTMNYGENCVEFITHGEIGEAKIKLKNCDETKIVSKKPMKLNFSINYLNHFCKCTNLDKKVKLSLSDESYLSVEFRVGERGYIKFFLAPKIEEDEEMNDVEENNNYYSL